MWFSPMLHASDDSSRTGSQKVDPCVLIPHGGVRSSSSGPLFPSDSGADALSQGETVKPRQIRLFLRTYFVLFCTAPTPDSHAGKFAKSPGHSRTCKGEKGGLGRNQHPNMSHIKTRPISPSMIMKLAQPVKTRRPSPINGFFTPQCGQTLAHLEISFLHSLQGLRDDLTGSTDSPLLAQ